MDKSTIVRYLMVQGFSPGYLGFYYFRECIYYKIATGAGTKQLYIAVAADYKTSWKAVEHCIRTLIRNWYIDMGKPPWKTPCNKLLIAQASGRLRLGNMERLCDL